MQDTRAGRLNDPRFSTRFSGVGVRADAIARLFKVCCCKYGLNQERVVLNTEHFRRVMSGQGELF